MKIWLVYYRVGSSAKMVADFWSTESKAQKSMDKWYLHYVEKYGENVSSWVEGPYTVDKRGGL